MRRVSTRTLAVVSLAGLIAAASTPALAKSSRPKQHRGKKAVGEIVSFDEATMTLTVDLAGDEDFTGAVDPDVQVKLDHRGWARKGGDGNPTEGSLDDLLPGAPVLRMKVEDALVTKIRIRPLPDEAPLPPAEGDDDEGDDSGSDASGDSEGDDASGDDTTDDSDSNPDEDSDGDSEDALPPLPVLQP